MKLSKKNEMKRHLVWVVFLSVAFLIQTTYGFMPQLFQINLYPVLPLLSCICMFEKEKYACWYGLFTGLLLDVVSPSMVGYHAFIFLLLCTGIGYFSTNYLRNTLLTNLVMGGLLIFISQSLYWLFFIEFKQTAGASVTYFTRFVPSMLLNTVLVIPFFFLTLSISKKLKAES